MLAPVTIGAHSCRVLVIFSPPGTSPTPMFPWVSSSTKMFRVKYGAWAPLRFNSMESWPATGYTVHLAILGVLMAL